MWRAVYDENLNKSWKKGNKLWGWAFLAAAAVSAFVCLLVGFVRVFLPPLMELLIERVGAAEILATRLTRHSGNSSDPGWHLTAAPKIPQVDTLPGL